MRPVSRPFIICAKPCTGCAAEQRRCRGAEVLEDQFAALHALVTELGQIPGDGQTGPVLDQQDADAAVFRLRRRVGLAQQRDQPASGERW